MRTVWQVMETAEQTVAKSLTRLEDKLSAFEFKAGNEVSRRGTRRES